MNLFVHFLLFLYISVYFFSLLVLSDCHVASIANTCSSLQLVPCYHVPSFLNPTFLLNFLGLRCVFANSMSADTIKLFQLVAITMTYALLLYAILHILVNLRFLYLAFRKVLLLLSSRTIDHYNL
jgi:hypothetical protein